MTAPTATRTLNFTYGDVTVPVQIPLRNDYRYTKGQQELVNLAVERGWALDVTAISNTCGHRFDSLPAERRAAYLKQHPFKFVRPGRDGGTWKLTLDYVSRDYSWYGDQGFNKTLKGAKLTFTAADGGEREFDAALSGYATDGLSSRANTQAVLQPTSRAGYAATNWLWEAAEGHSLRERVESLLADPEAVVDRAVALMAEDKAEREAREAERNRIRDLKARPLPAGWLLLQEVAAQVVAADGMTDIGALLADLEAAIRGVER